MKQALAIVSLLILTTAHANSSAASPLGSHWSSIIDSLTGSGISRIGNFDVTAFQAQANAVEWKPIQGAPPLTNSGSRQSAYYVCGQPAIHISEQLPAVAQASLAGLELHELLGALCFDDRNYAMSTALSVLARMANGPQRDKLLTAYAHAPYFHGTVLAGATSVSGGGDLDSLYVKDQVLEEIMGNAQNQKSATTDFLTAYPIIDFEPVTDVAEVYVKYNYSLSTKQETYQIMVPMNRWREGSAARAALIRETGEKIKTIFPAYASGRTHTFVPSACRTQGKNLSATFPVTNDPNMREIQEARAALTLGCNLIAGADEIGITAPALDVAKEPKLSGFYYFKCQATIDGRPAGGQNPSTQVGQKVLVSWLARSVIGGDSLEISSGVDRNGALLVTYFVYHGADGKYLSPVIVAHKNPNLAEASTQIAGKTISTSCRRVN